LETLTHLQSSFGILTMGHVIFYHFRCKNRPTVFLLSQSCNVPSRYHQSCRHLTSSTPHITKWEVVIAHPRLSSLYSLWLQGHSFGQLSPGHYLVAITQAAAQATIPRQHTRVLNVIETFVMCSSVIVSCFVISYCLIVQISSRIFRMTFCEIVEVNLAW